HPPYHGADPHCYQRPQIPVSKTSHWGGVHQEWERGRTMPMQQTLHDTSRATKAVAHPGRQAPTTRRHAGVSRVVVAYGLLYAGTHSDDFCLQLLLESLFGLLKLFAQFLRYGHRFLGRPPLDKLADISLQHDVFFGN